MKSQKFSNLIQLNAESIGIKTLDNEIINYLNTEIEEKIKMILFQSKKFMRISKRKTLKVDDLNNSLQFFNFPPLNGYDSYATSEFEKIEQVKGLWRQKQNIIDLEEYLSKPIASYPMKPFPHFHWFAIEGKRPNISENFIREEIKDFSYLDKITNDPKKPRTIINVEQPHQDIINNLNYVNNPNANIQNSKESNNNNNNPNNNDTIPRNIPVIHNISKELQIFFENFMQRFRKEVKLNLINSNSDTIIISKELEVSIDVVRTSPGVVELLPYIIEFLMKNIVDCANPKIYLIIGYYINAIIKNEYFFIEPYLHQIITLLLTLILIDPQNENFVDILIKIKLFSVKMLKLIIMKYQVKYPNLSHQLCVVFMDNINVNSSNLGMFGSIEGIVMLGPVYAEKAIQNKKGDIIEQRLTGFSKKNKQFIENEKKIIIKDFNNIDEDIDKKNEMISNFDMFNNGDIINRNDKNIVSLEVKEMICISKAYNTIKQLLNIYTNNHHEINKNN
jgi:hypothetical protein